VIADRLTATVLLYQVSAVGEGPIDRRLRDSETPVALTLLDLTLRPPLARASTYVYSVAFSADGHTLAADGADGAIRLWDVTNPRRPSQLGQPLTGPGNAVYSVAFSPDGRTLAASVGDGSIWLWNIATPSQPQILATLTGPSGAVFVDAFDTNRNVLATGGADKLVRL
jgi:hypothetical protein